MYGDAARGFPGHSRGRERHRPRGAQLREVLVHAREQADPVPMRAGAAGVLREESIEHRSLEELAADAVGGPQSVGEAAAEQPRQQLRAHRAVAFRAPAAAERPPSRRRA